MELVNKNILVVGLGQSGAAVCRFLKKRGAVVTITDMAGFPELGSLAKEMEQMGVHMELGVHQTETFENSDLIVLSPGVPHTIAPIKKAIEKGVEVIGEIELASRFINEPIIAVTGTNGKTTTTRLLGEMMKNSGFRVFVGGNIGNPLIGYADDEIKVDVVVAEISSFQLDTIKYFKPKVGVLLNITEDHLDRYPDFQAYADSKAGIFKNQDGNESAVINGDDVVVCSVCEKIKSDKLIFSTSSEMEKGAIIKDKNISVCLDEKTDFHVTSIGLQGNHNLENTAAAALAALAGGATVEGVREAIDQFKGLPHRLEFIGTKNGVKYYDDSKATNVDAVVRALENFDRSVILIMGGRDKGGDYRVLRDSLTKRGKALIVMGEAKDYIRDALGDTVPFHLVSSMEEAVPMAHSMAENGDSVVLSPACSSFDMFESYGQRGEVFKDAFLKLQDSSL